MDDTQTYIDDLNTEILAVSDKMQRSVLQNLKLKNDFSNQLREKDNENHKLLATVRELKQELQKLKSGQQKEERKQKKARTA